MTSANEGQVAGAATVRIYIDSKPADVPAASSALDAVIAWDASNADLLRSGKRVLVDNRGLPADPGQQVYNGAIFRVVSERQARSVADEPGTA